jgi:hypothetical protein
VLNSHARRNPSPGETAVEDDPLRLIPKRLQNERVGGSLEVDHAAAVNGTGADGAAGGDQWGDGLEPRVGIPTRESAVHAKAVKAVSNPRIAVNNSESAEVTNCELVPQKMFKHKRSMDTKNKPTTSGAPINIAMKITKHLNSKRKPKVWSNQCQSCAKSTAPSQSKDIFTQPRETFVLAVELCFDDLGRVFNGNVDAAVVAGFGSIVELLLAAALAESNAKVCNGFDLASTS